ncbi:hypothetical protein [Acidiphilium sp.]|uniref:hypothetical protein n=1 Tax=Acidiphilium sp. TaxID=527 RepID=UPI0025883DFD|nr:hypothetical protein [Acidiphilium sp.]
MAPRGDVLAYVTGRPAGTEVPGWVFWPLHALIEAGRRALNFARVILWPFVFLGLLCQLVTLAAAGQALCGARIYVVREAIDPFEEFDLFVTNEQIEAWQEVQASRCEAGRWLPF